MICANYWCGCDRLFQTLNGRVAEESDDPTLFSFSTENNVTCFMKANNVKGKRDWVKDLRAILDSQMQMKKGKESWCVSIPCWCVPILCWCVMLVCSHSMLVCHAGVYVAILS